MAQCHQNDQESLWSPVIHARCGLCYSIDLDKSKIFSSKLTDYERDIPVYTLKLTDLKDEMTWNWMVLMLHEKEDLPDAFNIHFVQLPEIARHAMHFLNCTSNVTEFFLHYQLHSNQCPNP